MSATLDDFRWLLSDAAWPWLDLAGELADDSLAAARRLRRDLSAERSELVTGQAALRRRGLRKFAAAERMFFTARGLEQATDERIAAHKARRFADGSTVADLCCGVGGDLMALAARGHSIGVDRDEVLAYFAAANARCEVLATDATTFDVAAFDAWHIDPDRRPSGRRTTRVDLHEPSAAAIDALRLANPHAAVKLAPAANAPEAWSREAELEWIGHDRQCQQLVAWFGELAASPGKRRATVLAADGAWHSIVGDGNAGPPVAAAIGRFVYEPHAAVLAARLSADLAARHGLAAVTANVAYLTGDHAIDDPALACFEVREVLPFDLKKLKKLLAERGIGHLEIKKRGAELDPAKLGRQLANRGETSGTLIVTRHAARVVAILAERRR